MTKQKRPVTRAFKVDPQLNEEYTMTELKEKFENEETGLVIDYDRVTNSYVILEPNMDPIETYFDFLNYVKIISLNPTKEVMPGLYDAGYIPYIIVPRFMRVATDIGDISANLLDIARALGITPKYSSPARYFADSATSDSDPLRWISRRDALRLMKYVKGDNSINEDDIAAQDAITTMEVLTTLLREVK